MASYHSRVKNLPPNICVCLLIVCGHLVLMSNEFYMFADNLKVHYEAFSTKDMTN